MVVNKQVNFIKCLSVLLSNVSSSMSEKFSKFYTKRIFDTDLAPSKTFAYDFKIGYQNSSSHRRSLDKLKGLFNKYLTKTIPAIQLASTEFLPMGASSGIANINLFNMYIGEALPAYNEKVVESLRVKLGLGSREFTPSKIAIRTNNLQEQIYFKSITELQSLHRYVRYLNYLARKHDVPVQLQLDRDYVWEGDNAEVSGRALIKIAVYFQSWYCTSPSDVERYFAIRAGETTDDALFSDESKWGSVDLDNTGKGHSSHRTHIAKFFLHLDKITNVLNTLTRKIEYGYSAFTFRT